MRVLDLFSGIGGFSLGLERAGMTTAAFCEIEEFPRAVLRKHWPETPIYDDVRTLTADRLARDGVGRIDLVCGGYPCQPFSVAGKRGGAADSRHLWPEMRRVVGEIRPAWVVAENVTGHVTMGLDQVLADLEGDGYAGRAVVVPAAAVDAWHIRQRVWIVAADTRSAKLRDEPRRGSGPGGADPAVARDDGQAESLADSNVTRLEGWQRAGLRERGGQWAAGAGGSHVPDARCGGGEGARPGERRRSEPARWLPEPDVGRVAHGIPRRMDRLRALGNAVVPQVVEEIGRAIMRVAGSDGESL